jgi:hypothetical protein
MVVDHCRSLRERARKLQHSRPTGSLGKEPELIEKTEEETDRGAETAVLEPPAVSDVSVNGANADLTAPPSNGRRERRTRRNSVEAGLPPTAEAAESNGHGDPDRKSRQLVRAQRVDRPRAPRAKKIPGSLDYDTASEDELADGSPPATDASAAAAEALVIDLSGKKPNRGTRTLKRARKKQEDAAAALAGATTDPALGALNRHLNMMMQQLGTAHRVIGRIAAERDALRQQLANVQGIPVDEIVVTSIGVSSDQPSSSTPKHHVESKPASGVSRFNVFVADDVSVMRKRRQMLVVVILLIMVVLWWTARMGIWVMPDNLSRESVTRVPFIGDFMSYFLAGWLFFRFVRVSSKGIKWVFPSDDPRRRRR